MKTLLTLFFLVPFSGFSQQTIYFTASGRLLIPRELRHATSGVDVSANILITDNVDIGVATGLLSFKTLPKPYIPLSGKLSLFPSVTKSALTPFLTLEPGYGLYSTVEQTAAYTKKTTAGFTFTTSAGVKLSTEKPWRPFFSLGYAQFGFRDFSKSKQEGVADIEKRYNLKRISLQIGVYL